MCTEEHPTLNLPGAQIAEPAWSSASTKPEPMLAMGTANRPIGRSNGHLCRRISRRHFSPCGVWTYLTQRRFGTVRHRWKRCAQCAAKSRAINHDLAVACGDAFYFGGGDAPNADVRSTRPVLQRNDRIVAIAWGLRFENPGAIRQCHSFAPRGCCANCLSRPLDGRSRLAQGTRCRST